MIARFRCQNFKLLRDVTLDLGRLNVLVGRNGAGKTSVLDAVELACRPIWGARDGGEEEDASWPRWSGVVSGGLAATGDTKVVFEVEGEEEAARWTRRWGGPPETQPPLERAVADAAAGLLRAAGGGAALHHEGGSSNLRVRALRLSAASVAAPHYAEEVPPRLHPTGAGVPTVLRYLHGLRDGRFERIEAALGQLIAGAGAIRAMPARIALPSRVRVTVDGAATWVDQRREVTGDAFDVDFAHVGRVDADRLSEGTLLVLGLLTALHYDTPDVLVLDDLDKGLHPVAQRELIGLLRDILAQRPGLQILATCHSPFVLDALKPEEVFVVGAHAGEAKVRRLDAHPACAKQRDYLTPGELWSAIGEGWVAEGEP